MIYLAAEIVLYLLAAAFVGLLCGWIIWGLGRRKQFQEIREDLASSLDLEMSAHQETRLALAEADGRIKLAVEQAKEDAVRSLGELRPTIENERKRAEAAEAELKALRGELEMANRGGTAIDQKAIEDALRAANAEESVAAEAAVKKAQMRADAAEAELAQLRSERGIADREGRTADQKAIEAALSAANAEKAAAAEAMAKEAQSRAQIEELRLLIGAEKLAAENARSELAQMQAGMQAELEAERTSHERVKLALDGIRSTLANTFGAEAANMVAGPADTADTAETESPPEPVASGITLGPKSKPSAVNMMTDIDVAGEALNNLDHDEADSEDREDLGLDLSPNVDLGKETTLNVEVGKAADAEDVQIRAVPDRIELRPVPGTPTALGRPSHMLVERPDDADDLQRIDGITDVIERNLNENGCYYYRQLADMTTSDIDWLAQAINLTPYQIADDRWIYQAKKLSPEHEDPDNLKLIDLSDRKRSG